MATIEQIYEWIRYTCPTDTDAEQVAEIVATKLVEEKFTPTNNARDAITPLVVRAANTDGCHHKQWYLEAIAEALQIELPPHDLGIAP